MTYELEEGELLQLDFKKLQSIAQSSEDVIPVVVQDIDSSAVLILAYANQAALQQTLRTKKATFWSTSRHALWIKGATSGDELEIVDVRVNCEQNSLLYRVRLKGSGACHTKSKDGSSRLSCYYRKISSDGLLEISEL